MPCIALYCIIAWRILFLTRISRLKPDASCECLFERIEWQLAYAHVHKKPPPDNVISLSDMMRLIAKLGGFLDRKNDKEPGPKAIWLGLKKLDDFVENTKVALKLVPGTYG